jgi:hypothetical protein
VEKGWTVELKGKVTGIADIECIKDYWSLWPWIYTPTIDFNFKLAYKLDVEMSVALELKDETEFKIFDFQSSALPYLVL